MELTIDGKPLMCEKGSEYLVPSGAKHFARFLSRTRVMDFFSEKSRYKPKVLQSSVYLNIGMADGCACGRAANDSYIGAQEYQKP
jgi:hypothetical protein